MRGDARPGPAGQPTAERKARQTFLLSASDSLSLINRTIAKAADLGKQLTAMIDRSKGSGGAALTPATALMDQLRFVQRRLGGGPGEGGEMAAFAGAKLRAEAGALVREMEGDGVFPGTLTGPTPDQQQRLGRITKNLQAAVDQVNKLPAAGASSANDQLRKH